MSAGSSSSYSQLQAEISEIERVVGELKTKSNGEIKKAKEQLSKVAEVRKGIGNRILPKWPRKTFCSYHAELLS